METAEAKTPLCCSMRQKLAQEFATAARLYAEAVALVTGSDTMANDPYIRLRNAARAAQDRAETARIAFEEHLDSHRCGRIPPL
jgi:hypothetical protein